MSTALSLRVGRFALRPGLLPAAAGVAGVAAVAQTLNRLAGVNASPAFAGLLCLLALATTLPVMLRPPIAAAAVVTAAGLVSLAAFEVLTLAGIVVQLVCAFRLGRHSPSAGSVVLGLPYLVLAIVQPAGAPVTAELLAGLVPTAVALGLAGRVRRDDAETQLMREAFAGTADENAARGERTRIARELHDVVAHHISAVSVQAELARLTVAGMPAEGSARLSAIGDTARLALTEMRRLLGVLREGGALRPAFRQLPPDLQPQPGISQLTDLLDQARSAGGSAARLIMTGRPSAMDPGVEVAAYRIVQEALTNARRHAPGAAVDVELRFTPDELRILVRDNGPGPPIASAATGAGGYGLLGMGERAAAAGGWLRSGTGTAGGFVVEAGLPVPAGPS